MNNASLTVMIPTYRRTNDLHRCLEALKHQTHSADEVVVVVRDTDQETWNFLEQYDAQFLPLRAVAVTEPGAVAAMNVGAQAAQCDLVAITDDDAAPWPDWLERIQAHFQADSQVGGVGGRDWLRGVPALEFGLHQTAGKNGVGKVQWFGRVIGDHHLGEGKPRRVDVLKGVNCAYRTLALQKAGFDTRLWGRGAQIHWELALGYAVKAQSYVLVYDPSIGVDHFSGQRHDEDQRVLAFHRQAHSNIVHNETLILLEHMNILQRIVFLMWAFAIGTRFAPGLAQTLRLWMKRQPHVFGFLAATLIGRFAGLRSYSRYRGMKPSARQGTLPS